ncbi:MAG: ATP-binding protein [Ilumatobacteraceae bacterium]|nr:ATP-binding protein [Ilumatobacteraceae bacterium]
MTTAAVLAMDSWVDAIRDRPLEAVALVVLLLAASVGAGMALREVTRRTRHLRSLVLWITLASMVMAAVAALALARLMVLDSDEALVVVGVLGFTAVFAGVLAVVASGAIGRDASRVEATVRRVEAGDRAVRTDVERADELGRVARAFDELTARLDALERERVGFETERRMMLSSVGHDLRTPLAALRAGLEALVDGVAPDPDRYLRSMQRQVEVLGALVDDLFLLSSIEAGRLEVTSEPLDLAELVTEAVESMVPAAAGRGIELVVDAPERVTVFGSAAAIGRVVRNLVDNALRHTPDGSEVRVAVSNGAMATVRVTDAGPGFTPEFATRAFERFARAEPSRSRSTGGAGLGLAIARGLVEAHGGRIWIEQAPGGRVAFELPAA